MAIRQPRYTKEEAAQLGDEIYDRVVKPRLEPDHNGEVVVIDLDSSDFEVDHDEIAATRRLEAHRPDAQMWAVTVGSRYLARFGARRSCSLGRL